MSEAPALSDRDIPAPWVLCEFCEENTALPYEVDRDFHYCPECAVQIMLTRKATDSLKGLIAPILGSWLNFWTAAGLDWENLFVAIENVTGDWANENHKKKYQTSALRYLRRKYKAPKVFRQKADRARFSFEGLPVLAHSFQDRRSACFVTTKGESLNIWTGRDTVILELLDGSRAVIYTGIHGQTDYKRDTDNHPAFIVPLVLWPVVAEVLGVEA
jgi:hypothetical protein